MKLISWNVNGFRACLNKGFSEFFQEADGDFVCLQETKMQPGQADFHPEDYYEYYNSAEKKGYSGTAIFARKALGEPLSVHYGMQGKHDDEGRLITLEYPDFYLVCCYVPNAQSELKRIDYRMEFEDDLRNHLLELNRTHPVIYCGDLNVAHEEIDLKNPKSNRGNAGFSDQERGKMTELLNAGFGSPTPSGISIPTEPEFTPGGPTGSTPGRTTPDGGLIILSFPIPCRTGFETRRF